MSGGPDAGQVRDHRDHSDRAEPTRKLSKKSRENLEAAAKKRPRGENNEVGDKKSREAGEKVGAGRKADCDWTNDRTLSLGAVKAGMPSLPDGTVPSHLQPSSYEVDLGDGVRRRVSASNLQKLDKAISESESRRATPRNEAPRLLGPGLLLTDPESGTQRVIFADKVPKGASIQNRNFVYSDEKTVQVVPCYPENQKAVDEHWRAKTKKPLIDSFGKEIRAPKGLLEANKKLNGWIKEGLESGMKLDQATRYMREQAMLELKQEVWKAAKLSLQIPYDFGPKKSLGL